MREPKVLFIIGKGRSGSTLLDNVLGQVDGFFSAGEVWRRWRWQPLENYVCGCGASLPECSIWSRALQGAYDELSDALGRAIAPEEIVGWEREVLQWHQIGRMFRAGEKGRTKWVALQRLALWASALYRSLSRATNARVIVDSTKWPANPAALGLVTGIQPFALHLIRDPRAVAFSWQRKKTYPAFGAPMARFGPINSSLSWVARNLAAEAVCRRLGSRALRLRYEDFVAGPRTATRAILDMLEEQPPELPFADEHTAVLGTSHTVMGNPSRFVTGPVPVLSDDEWQRRLKSSHHRLTTALTLPLLRRYRYPLRSTRRESDSGKLLSQEDASDR